MYKLGLSTFSEAAYHTLKGEKKRSELFFLNYNIHKEQQMMNSHFSLKALKKQNFPD